MRHEPGRDGNAITDFSGMLAVQMRCSGGSEMVSNQFDPLGGWWAWELACASGFTRAAVRIGGNPNYAAVFQFVFVTVKIVSISCLF